MSVWKQGSKTNEKPWGEEVVFSCPFGMSGKIISMNAGSRNSLKYYPATDQLMFCLKGEVEVYAPNEVEFGDVCSAGSVFNLKPGESILIQRENPYRIKALQNSVLVEVLHGTHSAPDPVRIADDYGRIKK